MCPLKRSRLRATALVVSAILLVSALRAHPADAQPAWGGYARSPQHTAISSIPSQSLAGIVWQTPVDLNPQYAGNGSLLVHYGTPIVTALNTIIFPVKTGVTDTFRVEARRGSNGSLLWQYVPDYTLPPHNWLPSYGPTLTPAGRLYIPGGGGTVLYTNSVDSAGTPTFTRLAFYGIANYNANPAAYNADIQICTPITSDTAGNIYFGYRTGGGNPLGLPSGLARIAANGAGTYITAAAATGGLGGVMLMNCAPAISNNGAIVYTSIRRPTGTTGFLVSLNSTTLAPIASVNLIDPNTGMQSRLAADGTASPMVAPDGKVYFGVLETPSASHNQRGWLLAFTSALAPAGVPGGFGWDDTPSLVPSYLVPSYGSGSPYLLMVKYNNYAGIGTGDGQNKLAVLDPNNSQIDLQTNVLVMKEVLTIKGPTPDSAILGSYPNAVREWCINTAAVDSANKCVLAGCEDGKLYRWDLTTNTFTQSVVLTTGIGEAYTPTLVGRDGRVYAINNAILFSVGVAAAAVDPPSTSAGLDFSRPYPNPFARATSLRFSVARPGRVNLEIFDAEGRRVARLLDREMDAGEHSIDWQGRTADGRLAATGIYFARLRAAGQTVTRRLVLAR